MRMRLLLAAYILFFAVVAAAEILPEDEKCLDIPDVTPKKYFHLKGKSLAIKLETSKRITHRLTTELFYIFIKEVLGYSKIEVNVREDDFQIEPVIERLSDYYHQTVSEPPATINLEVWVRPDYDTTNASQFVDECGTVGPPGRFGWFIPLEAARPVRTYYAKHLMSQNMFEVHWSLFLDPNLVRYFDISDRVISAMVKNENYNRRQDTGDYVCSESLCKESMYVPEQCRNTTCATLLAPGFNVSSFLVDQIDEMKLLVKVLWLGDNLRIVVEELSNLYALSRSNNSVVFFHWYPSEMVIDQRDFVSVLFTNNEIMEFTHKEAVGYKYEMHRLVKLAWSKIQKNAQPLYDSLRFFKLKESDYVNLLYLYEEYRANWPMRSIACNWMRNHTNVWKNWLGLYQTFRTPIYIGGIFPVNATSYNGKGIVTGAVMAQTAINKNPSILAHYNLQLIAFDGKCEADTVMKKFIDFIVEGYYPQLVGVLGPACSETVEPLAGVSRHYHIMVISYSAEGASFSDRTKYPYFFRTIGENKHYKHVYLKLFQRFGWKRVAALTEDGQKYTEYISLMQDDLEKNNIKFIANKKFPRERETEAMTRYLKDLKSKRARIIIADVVDDIARVVMCEAYKLEMTSAQGYVWFLPIWLNNTWYNTDQFNRNQKETVNCTSDEMKKAINGYFAMTHAYFAPDNAVMQENITVGQWRENYAKRTREPSNYAGFAYDAVWTYALALDKLAKTDPEAMSDLHSETTTNKLVRLVEDTDFHGVSGRIKFRGGPSRFSVIDVMQWYSDSMHTVGHFHPSLSENKPEILGGVLWLNESAVKWFTPDRAVPDDGTPPPEVCTAEFIAKLFNVSCQTAMIIANIMLVILLTLVLVAVCFYMKKKAVLIKSCWVKEPKDRHKASEIVAFLANNPKVVEPCLDAPLASVQLEDSNQAELGLPTEFREFRKSSTSSKSSPVKPNVTIEMEPVLPLYQPVDEKSDLENVPIEQSHVKEPLLGPGKPSSGSRLNLGKLVTGKQPKWDEENQDCPSSPEDGTS
ncbi:hypothetical protein NQ315_016308 [Exocentrus adspersus]|uniref:Gamma-aminobutyric acid type B receptor subunit 2 n=1 Tax=Exocentrus adspersus TaxID=1586481 RepID=A0AAV8VQA2_9CUCU|nr:hypothetical protein NQ315_016308 [Exocentrus adspersus]